MLLTITTTRAPATDLGYLLHKHPDRLQTFETAAGAAHVFYPEATAERCTAALLLEVDPIALVRGRTQNERRRARPVRQRPPVRRLQHARGGPQGGLPDRADRPLRRPARARQQPHPAHHQRAGPALPRRRGAGHSVFQPLGWTVETATQPLQPAKWGASPYLDLRLTGEVRLADALNHLYVLLPVLDDAKHYWVSTDEVDKLIRAGGDWLAAHPAKELITRRYLSHQRRLTRSALARLAEADDTEPEELDNAVTDNDDTRKPLAVQRREAILAILRELDARTVGDFGCGSGVLTKDLLAEPQHRPGRRRRRVRPGPAAGRAQPEPRPDAGRAARAPRRSSSPR